MHGERTILEDLALVLCVAAVTTVVFRRLRQPVVLGYLLAGLIVGPHIPIPLFADHRRIQTLSELGVILVMFSVGLEFSIRRLVKIVPTAGVIGLIEVSTMIWLGSLTAAAFGWTSRESLFTGAMVAISSTMIVAKVFAEQRVDRQLSEVVFGVLVIQDLVAILLLAVLTALSTGGGAATGVLAQTAGQLAAFLAAMVVGGFLIVPRAIRLIARLQSPETLLVGSIGVCFAMALIAEKVGYSVALGAFLAGSLVAESGHAREIEHLVQPVRDMFAAVFFVSVGMIIDPAAVVRHGGETLALALVVIVGQIASVSLGAFLSGSGLRTAVRAGMSLAQIGEFSFIIASVGVASGAIRPFLYPVAIAVSVITSFTTPWLIRASDRVARLVDHKLPKPLQTLVSLYGSWLDGLRASRSARVAGGLRRLVVLLLVDWALLAGIAIGASVEGPALARILDRALGVVGWGRWIVAAGGVLLSLPFIVGIVRLARALGAQLATLVLPAPEADETDPAATPRRAIVVTLQLGLVVLTGVPLMALTQPFLPPLYGLVLFVLVLSTLGVGFWRNAAQLQQHVQAGAQLVVEALARQSATATEPTVEPLHPKLPGLGPLTTVHLRADSPAVGQTLAQLDLRALSGASAIAIGRDGGLVRPTGREELRPGDVIALAGTMESIGVATAILLGSPAPSEPQAPAS